MELLLESGYLAAAICYFLLILLLVAARNKTMAGGLVVLGCLSILASFWLGALQQQQSFSLKWVLIAENFKLLCWPLLIVVTRHGVASFKQIFKTSQTKQFLLLWLGLSALAWIAAIQLENGAKYLFMLFLVLNLWLMVMLEQLYRNAEVKAKWALWPLVIGLGAITVFDFIMFAQAAMLSQLDFSFWTVRPFVAILAIPFLLICTRRMKDWSVNVFVSRDVVFYSSMLLISGLYLLVMAIAGYLINYYGGHWGSTLSLAFVVLGGVVLAVLLMTERLRREVKVFITKHFFANKYDYRIEWLKLIDQLELNSKDDFYQTALKVIRQSLEISYGVIVGKHPKLGYRILYADGIEANEAVLAQLAIIEPYCVEHNWIIDVREYEKLEHSYPELLFDSEVFNQQGISLIIPIWSAETIYGFFLLSSPKDESRFLNWEDRDLLTAIAKQLNHYLALNEAQLKLAESKQFDAFNRMSAFLVHDLKNIQAQLALINSNAEKHRHNPAFIDDVFETVASATERLDKTLTQLRNKTVTPKKLGQVNVTQLLQSVVERRNVQKPQVKLNCAEQINMNADAETLSSVVNHLVQNAQEATADDGNVVLSASFDKGCLRLEIADNGSGMSENFIKTRLFKAFDTTKGNAGMGIGVFEAKQFVEGLGGSIHVVSKENQGTTFTLIVPEGLA